MLLLSRLRCALAAALLATTPALAQVPTAPAPPAADTLRKYENPLGVPAPVKKPWYKGKLVKAVAVPAVLIGYGAYTVNGGGFYTNEEARRDLKRVFPGRSVLDDYMIFAPYLELGAVALAGVETNRDRLNVGLVILKSQLIMVATVFPVKSLVREPRPDGSDNLSFPSGHTAQAFLAASIVHTELRHKSQWYGVGAYALATSVAAMRMINNKHWQSDVVAGAGFGILSAHLGYLSHRNRWGRQPRVAGSWHAAPAYWGGGATGLSLRWSPSAAAAARKPVAF